MNMEHQTRVRKVDKVKKNSSENDDGGFKATVTSGTVEFNMPNEVRLNYACDYDNSIRKLK
jgi:hypothetical protein